MKLTSLAVARHAAPWGSQRARPPARRRPSTRASRSPSSCLPGQRQGGLGPDHQRHPPGREGRRRRRWWLHDHRPALRGLRRRAQRRARPADRREQHDQDRRRPEIVAVIGPLNSSVAKAQIPISNEAGLLQCSPANTNPELTKGAPAPADPDQGQQLHPRRHHGRDPGPGRGRSTSSPCSRRRGLHHRRHRDLREARSPTRSRLSSRPVVAPS